jgi:hypothetical protein
MPIDSFFSFDLRAEQINQAFYGTYHTLSNLTIQNLSGGLAGINGIYDTLYTDGACNSANTALAANINPYQLNSSVPSPYHTTALLRYTNPGFPVPAIYKDIITPFEEAYDSQEFHGTCKPVSLGDYVSHTSQNAAIGVPFGFDNHFVTAGYDPVAGGGVVGININQVTEPSATSFSVGNVGSITSGLPGSITSNGQIRLFTHPSWRSGPNQHILLIAWDNTATIYLEKYDWDGMNLVASANPSGTISSAHNVGYSGQHDILFTNSGNILLQTRNASFTAGMLYEIDGNNLTTVASQATRSVAYDATYNVIGIRRSNNFETYAGTLSGTAVSSVSGVFTNGTRAYDAVWHPDEPGVIYVGEQISATSIVSHAFFYDPSGVVSSNTNRGSNMGASVTFNQIERTSPNVIVSFAGPNTTIPFFRSVCNAATYIQGGYDYTDTITPGSHPEDMTIMRHPTSQDYTRTKDTNGDSTIKGNNHLISVDYSLNIGCFGQNLATKHWNYTVNLSLGSHHMYILYLGYFQDTNFVDSYSYLGITGINFQFIIGQILPSTNIGGISWVKFRNS